MCSSALYCYVSRPRVVVQALTIPVGVVVSARVSWILLQQLVVSLPRIGHRLPALLCHRWALCRLRVTECTCGRACVRAGVRVRARVRSPVSDSLFGIGGRLETTVAQELVPATNATPGRSSSGAGGGAVVAQTHWHVRVAFDFRGGACAIVLLDLLLATPTAKTYSVRPAQPRANHVRFVAVFVVDVCLLCFCLFIFPSYCQTRR
jgi:hypothetical protein